MDDRADTGGYPVEVVKQPADGDGPPRPSSDRSAVAALLALVSISRGALGDGGSLDSRHRYGGKAKGSAPAGDAHHDAACVPST